MELGAVLNLCIIILGLGIVMRWFVSEKLARGKKGGLPSGLGLKLPSLSGLLKRRPMEEDSPLKVLGAVSFGLRERVVLLGVGHRRFLLALNRGEFSLLSSFEEGPAQVPEPQRERAEVGTLKSEPAFPFPLDGDEDSYSLKPLSEIMKKLEDEFPFLKEAER
ncbi:MAG: hypothetical protein DRG31_07905 [Deltaproteobacteria bacterium]|nr:MAG: hypothetical protein DRG31_07905 [Deltaproteobacteria bacterium]